LPYCESVVLTPFQDAGLKSLSLSHSTDLTLSVPRLPFKLNRLALVFGRDYNQWSFALLDALACQTSITSLEITAIDHDSRDSMSRLERLAPQLVTLQFVQWNLESSSDFLKLCTQLKHLTLSARLMNYIEDVVVPLASWTIMGLESFDSDELLEILKSEAIAVTQLERLVVESDYEGGWGWWGQM
jgi:hypothetical protein